MFLILLNYHTTLCYCVQSLNKIPVTIYQNKIIVFAVALADTQAKIPFKHFFNQHAFLLALYQSFIQFYKLHLRSIPVAIEHWSCDVLCFTYYRKSSQHGKVTVCWFKSHSPSITHLLSMKR